ncbi:MAG: hypothetical protein ACFFG0_42285 [Candidatus Thorarchaeota archaeon]
MEFKPYNYGPFSKKVFDFIVFFENLGLLEISYEENPEKDLDRDIFIDDLLQEDDSEWVEGVLCESKEQFVPVYSLTERGKKYVEERLWKFLDNPKIEALDKLKRNCVETPLKLLIKYVYTNYPEFAAESKIKETILKETKWQF